PFPVDPPPPSPATPAPPPASPARPVPLRERRRLKIEVLIVLAVFPLPYVFSALQALVGTLLGKHEGARIPTIFPGHSGAGFPFVVLETLLPLAAAALVMYVLWLPGGDGGPGAIGLDRTQPRGDAALLLIVFLLCNVLPIVGGGLILYNLGVRGTSPAAGHFPAYYDVAYVVSALVAGVVEEVVVLGYLVRRLEQLAFRPMWVLVIAVAVRGSYHLYYGWDVLPILAWAAVTVIVYRRYRRLWPFIAVHVLWDVVTLLHDTAAGMLALIVIVAMIVFTAVWHQYLPPRPPVSPAAASETQSWHGR
ncbi:MAG TPA: CPBP family intramembrane glutamic endopeptidase, partial [Acidimicrobiales bacterium]|nr:CPBP family intramembrane glutamic endopeptidase [Acidimicrobiales bacterium]